MKIVELEESLDRTLPFTWNYKSEEVWTGSFSTDKEKYNITCAASLHDGYYHPDLDEFALWYDLSFSTQNDGFSGQKVIGTSGNEFKIFATVVSAFRDFLFEKHPEFIIINSYKGNASRFKLYKAIYKKMANDFKKLGYIETDPPKNKFLKDNNDYDVMAWRLK